MSIKRRAKKINSVSITSHNENGTVEVTITSQKGFQSAYDCLSVISPASELSTVFGKLLKEIARLAPHPMTVPEVHLMNNKAREKLRDKSMKCNGWRMGIH